VRLQEQPFQVLRLLLERHGEIVTRDELKQRLWAADTFVDFDDGLNTAVKKIRDLLGDSAERPRFIETIPRRGYRFIAEVEPALADATAVAHTRVRAVLWLAVAMVLVAAVIVLVGKLLPRSRPVMTSVHAIAVLPLQNLSGDASQDYFAAGLTDALTTELARTVGPSVRVTSRTSAEKYGKQTLAEIARELDVDAVIEGSVVRSGNRARITAQLINARADQHLWAASYDRDLRDMLSLQHEIAATIARQVQITLSPRTQARLATAVAVDPEAYDSYQRGRYLAFSNNRQDLATSIAFLEKAVKLDPNLASAYALLARAYRSQVFMFERDNHELEIKSDEALNHALKLDPDLADAYLVRGTLYWTHDHGFPHERAMHEQMRAIELDPSLAEAHHELGKILMHVGLLERAEQELQKAAQIDPTNIGVRYRIAIVRLDEGKVQDAIASLEGTRAFAPELWTYQMAFALYEAGRKQEAASLLRTHLRDNPRDEGGVGNAMQALLYADAGRPSLAEQSIRAAVEKGRRFGHFHHAAYTIGAAYAAMNRPQEAVRWLRFAADDGFPCYPVYLHDRSLDKLRGNADFERLLADLKTRWEHYKSIS